MRFELTTLLFETINFFVLMFLLRKLLYQPLRKALETRRAALVEEQQAARSAREQAEALRAEYETQRGQLAALQEETRNKALEEAVAERARMLNQAREEATAERAHVQRLLESERRAAEDWVRSVAIDRSTDLAGRMLLSLAPEAVESALQTRLWQELKRDLLDNQTLRDTPNLEVEVIGAELPSETTLESLSELLRNALGKAPSLTVRTDENLRAGLIVRMGDRAYDASIAGQLDALRGVARELLEGTPLGD